MSQVDDVRTRLHRDDRVPHVERVLLGVRLGLAGDDLELLADDTVVELLALPASVTLTIAAARLLERLDAHVAWANPVDLEHDDDDNVVVGTVALGSDGDVGTVTAALQRDLNLAEPLVVVEVDDREVVSLDVDETQALGHTLLRLVDVARGDAP